MASLRLTFPEKDEPTVIALTGARLTIGRLPFNTIQIIDRTVSGFHAELISEHGHYRLHDRGSSNGTFVNGQKVSDYHLNEACTVSFGTVEAQFQPEDVAAETEAETFPSRGEVNSVRQENVEMKATVAALREEIDALRHPAKTEPAEGAPSVSREEYERVVVEREALKEAQLRLEDEIGRLKTDLAILKRDRVNLQLAYDGAQREVEQLKRKEGGADEAPALAPVEAAAVIAAQIDKDTVKIELPKPAVPRAVPSVPAVEEAPLAEAVPAAAELEESASASVEATEPAETPAVPPVSPGKLFVPGSKPPTSPSAPSVPGQAPKPPPPAHMPFKPVKPMAAPGTPGAPKAPTGLGGAKPPGNVPTTRLSQRPLPTKLPSQANTVKLTATPPPKTGPKGTQKLKE